MVRPQMSCGHGSFTNTDGFIYEKGTVKQQLTNLDYSRPNTVNGGVEVVWAPTPTSKCSRRVS